jgi:hypothetical protein
MPVPQISLPIIHNVVHIFVREQLAIILSTGQKPTGMTGAFERHQIFIPGKYPCEFSVLYAFAGRPAPVGITGAKRVEIGSAKQKRS